MRYVVLSLVLLAACSRPTEPFPSWPTRDAVVACRARLADRAVRDGGDSAAVLVTTVRGRACADILAEDAGP